jgi:hypothetical protein
MGKNPDDWPEVIAPDAFDGIDQDVPLTFGTGGPVIGTAHTKGTPKGLEVTFKIPAVEGD